MEEASIYPGTYHPPFPWRSFNHREDGASIIPRYIIRRSNGLIELICWIPGARRSDIQLFLRNHRFFLCACAPTSTGSGDEYPTIRYQFEHSLPVDTDTGWFSAEYQRGLLVVRFQVTREPYDSGFAKVVIY